MQEKRRVQISGDQGFTVAEIVISMAILFFAITALLGLLSTNTSMTATSKSKSVLTNAIAAELDNIRTKPYEQVALTTADPPGVIEPTKTYTKDGFTVTLTFDISERSATKEVRVSGLATREGFPDTRTSSFAAIRDVIGGVTSPGDANGPTIAFTATTPRPGSILKGSVVQGGGDAIIGAHAKVEDANINKISMTVTIPKVGDRPLKNQNTAFAQTSGWEETPEPEVTYSFKWDTRQIDNTSLESEVPDGNRTVTITAYDDQTRVSPSKGRMFIVDNHPPALATNLRTTHAGFADLTQQMSQTWTDALDGDNISAPVHELDVYKNTTGGTLLTSWSPMIEGANRPTTITVDALSEYAYRVRARSFSNLWGEYAQSSPMITRPVLNGYYNASFDGRGTVRKWTYEQHFTIPRAESFWSDITILLETTDTNLNPPVSTQDITSLVETAWNADQPYNFAKTWTSTKLTGGVVSVPPTYRLIVSVVPTGYGGGNAVTVNSNTVKGADLAASASTPRNSQPFAIGW